MPTEVTHAGDLQHAAVMVRLDRSLAPQVWTAMYPDRRPWDALEPATQTEWHTLVAWVLCMVERKQEDPALYRQRTAQDADTDGWVEGLVRVEINEMIRKDLEGFLDILSERLTGSALLMGINYDVQRYDELNDQLVLLVSGDASQCFPDDDE